MIPNYTIVSDKINSLLWSLLFLLVSLGSECEGIGGLCVGQVYQKLNTSSLEIISIVPKLTYWRIAN